MGSGIRSAFQPKIIETVGVPELFCDIAVIKSFSETVRIWLARESADNPGCYELVGMYFMPRSGYERSRKMAFDIVGLAHH